MKFLISVVGPNARKQVKASTGDQQCRKFSILTRGTASNLAIANQHATPAPTYISNFRNHPDHIQFSLFWTIKWNLHHTFAFWFIDLLSFIPTHFIE
jgi:hypothetical protein